MNLRDTLALNAGAFGESGWSYGGKTMPTGYIPKRTLSGFPKVRAPKAMPSQKRVSRKTLESKGGRPGGPGSKDAGIQTPKDKMGNFDELKKGAKAPEAKHDFFEKHKKKAVAGPPVTPKPNQLLKKMGKAKPFGGKVKASEMNEPPGSGAYGHAHIDPVTWFRPPSLTKREKDSSARIPSDDVRETNDRFMDVTKRNSKDTREQRMKMLRRSAPGGNPPMFPVRTTAVSPHQGAYTPMAMMGSARKTKLISRPARMNNERSGKMKVAYDRQGCI